MPARSPLTGHRYLGLAGSLALTVGAYRVGARPGGADRDGLPGLADLPALAGCGLGLVLLTAAWWQIGRRTARPNGPPLTGRWMLVTAALWALPALLAPPLASRDIYAYACQGAAFLHPGDPCPWLASVPPVWRGTPSPYGPTATLVAAAAAGSASAAGGRIVVAIAVLRLAALAGVLLGVHYGAQLARRFGVPSGRAAWLGLASPLVLLHVAGGAHHDALLTGLVLAALAYAVAGRGWPAGVALALAAAVKVTAVVALPFAALAVAVALRGRIIRAVLTVGGVTALGYLALAVPTGVGLNLAPALSRTGDLGQWTSAPTAVGMSAGYLLRAVGLPGAFDPAVATAQAVGLVVLAALVAALVWRIWSDRTGWIDRSDRTDADPARAAVLGAGVAFAGLAMLGPVFYPWYALTPLALIAVSTVDERVRAWCAAAAGVLAFLVLPNGVGLAPRTRLPGAVLVTAGLLTGALVGQRRRRWFPTPARRLGGRATPTATTSSASARSRPVDPRSVRAPAADPGSPTPGNAPPLDR
ncbi:MAG: polyprenol phosphomannose-dependent alpha 1,6 mannosyltransferase MptB [Micromonosporaceae bacterium]